MAQEDPKTVRVTRRLPHVHVYAVVVNGVLGSEQILFSTK